MTALPVVITATVLVAVGAAAGVPCSMSMATEYVEVDGFLNGLISTVAGIGATSFPLVVPMLARAVPAMGFQALMAATLAMAIMQILSLVGMLLVGRAIRRNGKASAGLSPLEGVAEPLL